MASDYGIVRDVSSPGTLGKPEEPPSPETLERTLELVRELGSRSQMGGMGREQGDRNPRIPAGFTFLGQFIGHDITHDSGLNIKPQDDSNAPRNLGTPTLDLDGLYGSGPDKDPHLYDSANHGKFLLDKEREFDLPRDPQGTALIGDLRNDRNLILSQLHLAFLKFHNTLFERARWIDDGIANDEGRFEKTQRFVQWHYQWIIVREFLPLLVGPKMVRDILIDGSKWYNPQRLGLFIPLEFSVAAYRFGHSQVDYLYRINDQFRFPLFSAKPPSEERQDLRGGPIKEEHTINWKNFFDTGVDPTPSWDRQSKKINTKITGPLLFPPSSVALNRSEESQSLARKSLAVRDLERGQKRNLPSGQDVAAMMDSKGAVVAVLCGKKRAFAQALGDLPPELQKETPLWYFILKEAEVQHDGMMLGDVGGRIVAEVIIGLLQADSKSIWEKVDLVHLHEILRKDERLKDSEPLGHLGRGDQEILRKKSGDWKPTLSIERNGDFTMADLLKFAEVDTK